LSGLTWYKYCYAMRRNRALDNIWLHMLLKFYLPIFVEWLSQVFKEFY